jgi:quinol monooxygenase YgiN
MPVETVICTFRVKPDQLDSFLELLRRHYPTLSKLELVTGTAPRTYLGADRQGPGPVIVDIFEWIDGEASGAAHQHPEVAAIWEAMEPLCESRHGLPAMDFPHFEPLAL